MTWADCVDCDDADDCGCGRPWEHHVECLVCDYYICAGSCCCEVLAWMSPIPTDLMGYPGVTE